MAVAETAKLIAALGFKDNFSPGAKKAMGTLGALESTGYRVGQNIGKGLSNAATNIKRIGLVAAAGIGVAVHQGIDSLATLEDAETGVTAALSQMGLAGKVTAAQVAGWANDIEASVGAAFDDKDITAAATTLIRYGKVTASNLKPALVVMTDLAAKTGSVDSAASLLSKALADPEKAAGKLARTGVVLTKAQQAQIKAMVKAGKTAQAQKYLLDVLAKTTKGAAEATQGPYRRALSTLADVTEDAQRALAIGFLPVLEKVAGIFKTELAKPETLKGIQEFGKGLASGLDSLIDIAKNLPWAQIGDAFKLAGSGAKAILTAFTSLPPWVQTAVLTGWGLNKLTGGALGGIVGEIGKGLIKGVLGMNAAVVNINAGVVNGGGAGIPGAVAGGAAAGTGLAFATSLIAPAAVAAVALMKQNEIGNQADALREQAKTFAANAKDPDLAKAIDGLKQKLSDPVVRANTYGVKGDIVDILNTLIKEQNRRNSGGVRAPNYLDKGSRDERAMLPGSTFLDKGGRDEVSQRLDKVNAHVGDLTSQSATWAAKNHDAAVGIGASVDKGAGGTIGSVDAAKYGISSAVMAGTGAVAAAVRNNPPPIVNVVVSVTPTQIERTTTIVRRSGPTNGSSGSTGAIYENHGAP